MKKSIFMFTVFSFLNGGSLVLAAADQPLYEITIKQHQFSPSTLAVPANQKIKIAVRNEDTTPEEFESYSLNREKVVAGNAKIMIFVGPLKPGVYEYFGDFHKDLAKGKIEAK